MDDSDLRKYVLEQASKEVEHNRSWPTKVMAFYIAINFGITTALIALRNDGNIFACPYSVKTAITIVLLVLALWVIKILNNNHKNYLKYRNLQIANQKQLLEKKKSEFELPDEWFTPLEVSGSTRYLGWGLYAYIVVMTTTIVITGIWAIL